MIIIGLGTIILGVIIAVVIIRIINKLLGY